MDKLKYALSLFKKGNSVSNPQTIKHIQLVSNLVISVLLAITHSATGALDTEKLDVVIIVFLLLAAVNIVATVVSSKTVGLAADPDTAVNSPPLENLMNFSFNAAQLSKLTQQLATIASTVQMVEQVASSSGVATGTGAQKLSAAVSIATAVDPSLSGLSALPAVVSGIAELFNALGIFPKAHLDQLVTPQAVKPDPVTQPQA